MMKTKRFFYLTLANFLVFLHIPVLFILLFGWRLEHPSWVYPLVLMGTLGTQIVTNSCILTKWEFTLRKKLDPTLSYDASFLSFYAYKYSNIRISSSLLRILSYLFLSISLLIYYKYTLPH
jgi:hypothetical protein